MAPADRSHGRGVEVLMFSPTGTRLASAGVDKRFIFFGRVLFV